MIPEQTTNQITSTVDGAAIAMSIDTAAMGHIMNVLTNLYSDEELACVREYSTNALDSHIEAEQSRPIEVTLPTELRPILSIRDYGLGLSAEEIETIYSQYGTSTKRASNDAVGMLGLGCKSALAYVDQFTLISVKDGERITVSVARDENGAGVMTINAREETDDLPGVEVLIPAKRYNSFEEKAYAFFKYWEPGTVLVNGEEPEAVETDWQIDEEFSIVTKGDYERKLRIVMGNVSYPISAEYERESNVLCGLPDDKQIIARVPIGMVSFTPSREALQEHPATKAALDQILATFTDACSHAIKSQIREAPDKPSAARTLIAARNALGPKNIPAVTYDGEMIPTVISAEDLPGAGAPNSRGDYRHGLWKSTPNSGGMGHRAPAGQISLDDAAVRPWIVNYTNQNWSKTQRQKFNRYLAEHPSLHNIEEPRKVIAYITSAPAVPLPDWIEGNVFAIDWETVRNWKDPLTVSEGGTAPLKYAGTYPTYYWSDERQRTLYRNKFEAYLLPKSGRNLYWCRYGAAQYQKGLGPRAVVVECPDHRLNKFLRLFPHARNAREVLQSAAQSWWARLDEDAALAVLVGNHANYLNNFMHLQAPDVEDAALAEAIAASNHWTGDEKLRKTYSKFSPYLDTEGEADGVVRECKRITARYALMDLLNGWNFTPEHCRHITLYVNAVYAAETR